MAIKEVKAMHDCRLKALNKDFYLHKYNAEKLTKDFNGKQSLSQSAQKKLVIFKSQFAFEMADYLYQIGKRQEARDIMFELSSNSTLNITTDTAQWLNFLYHQGKILFEPYYINKNRENILRGYDCLIQCYILSSRNNYQKYQALAMQTLSMYLRNDSVRELAKDFDHASIRYLNDNDISDTLLAGNLAERAVDIFLSMNDTYLTADAWRNLASCYLAIGNANSSIECLHQASAIPATHDAPDLLSRINEQFSISYAAIDDKHLSDYYRNAYLDQQDSTRQDRQLEARVDALQEATERAWRLAAWGFAAFILLCITIAILSYLRKKKGHRADKGEEELEVLNESLQALTLQLSNEQRAATEQRARISIVNGMLPLIDRMKLAINKAAEDNATDATKRVCLKYASELSEAIDHQNAMLTQWIKLRQGSIAPKIENVNINNILQIIKQSASVLSQHDINLDIKPCTSTVKADAALTLFLINTLMDNARKAMTQGGTITIDCREDKDAGFAEVSVSDNGKGMTEEQLTKVLDPLQTLQDGASHGFGLINCKGIIDRYRKISSQFTVCTFNAESQLGKGTSIRFRLPLAAKMLLTILCFVPTLLFANTSQNNQEAARFTDSLYECNIACRYTDAMLYADSCYNIVTSDSTIDNRIKLSLYNETAVAALALHQWDKYRYFNYMYNLLYKQCTADTTLTTYCQKMEQREQIANISMIVVLLLIIMLIPAFWFFYLRHFIYYRRHINTIKEQITNNINKTKAEYEKLHIINNITSNQLSALKHETMYYPTRIRQLIDIGGKLKDIESAVNYYRELYAMLSTKGLNKQMDAYTFRATEISLTELFPSITNENNFTILANKELITYLKLLLKRNNGGTSPSCQISNVAANYISIDFTLTKSSLTEEQTQKLFTTDTPSADYLTMRQILRETGSASLHYTCGISASMRDETPIITITLPYKSNILHR